MISLSRRRNDSSTAFLTHWCTAHSPPCFSATRRLPASSWARVCATASFTPAGDLEGEMSVRFSQASSISFCMSVPALLERGLACGRGQRAGGDEFAHPGGRLDGFLDGRDEG